MGLRAVASIAGAKALAKKNKNSLGLIIELPELADLKFIPFNQMAFGGHEVRKGTLQESFANLNKTDNLNIQYNLKAIKEGMS